MSAKTRQSLLRAKLAQQLLSQAKGFTLIELLVVIAVSYTHLTLPTIYSV